MEVLRFRLPGHGDATLRNLNQLRSRQRFCDVTIVANDNQQFRGHKVVLAACSPFLRDQFLLNPSSELQVSGLHSSGIVCELLQSCYTGVLQFTVREIVDYLTAASYLQMEHVVEKCRGALSQFIEPQIATASSPYPNTASPGFSGFQGNRRFGVMRATAAIQTALVNPEVQCRSWGGKVTERSHRQPDRSTENMHSVTELKVKVEEAAEAFLEEECEEDYEDFPEVCIIEEEEEEEEDDGQREEQRAAEAEGGGLASVGSPPRFEAGGDPQAQQQQQEEEEEETKPKVQGARGQRDPRPRGRRGAAARRRRPSGGGERGMLGAGVQEAGWGAPSLESGGEEEEEEEEEEEGPQPEASGISSSSNLGLGCGFGPRAGGAGGGPSAPWERGSGVQPGPEGPEEAPHYQRFGYHDVFQGGGGGGASAIESGVAAEEEEPVGVVGSTSCPGPGPGGLGAIGGGGVGGSDPRPVPCQRCGTRFPSAEALAVHARAAHFLFVCPRCGKQFNHSSNLNRHLNVHRGVKSHRCHLCHKTFTQKSTLADHMNLHSGERPYRCSYCLVRFAHKPAIRRHLKEQHGKTTAQNRERGGD
ncbi:zinc finger and BTB domain-containing protein 12-like isoform X1 [Lepisosteus oculatus]|uniref:zinc finger and BTB domain-containing protein 12-like isoform X1 n=1 Tax=Lepisosteus oculatus TaxID=7918 RepID=UPI0035F5021D